MLDNLQTSITLKNVKTVTSNSKNNEGKFFFLEKGTSASWGN